MKRFLVTAGSTREAIDRVRDWGNIFTGNTGRALAEALAAAGGSVELLTSNAQHAHELAEARSSVQATLFRSHADLRKLLVERMTGTNAAGYDAIFMTAAVADYAPQRVYSVIDRKRLPDGNEQWLVRDVHAGKVKSTFPTIAVVGERTEKLVDLFRRDWRYGGVLVKFKLEVGISEDQLIDIAEASRRASDTNFIVANTLEMVEGPSAGAWLLGPALRERVPRSELPRRLTRLVI